MTVLLVGISFAVRSFSYNQMHSLLNTSVIWPLLKLELPSRQLQLLHATLKPQQLQLPFRPLQLVLLPPTRGAWCPTSATTITSYHSRLLGRRPHGSEGSDGTAWLRPRPSRRRRQLRWKPSPKRRRQSLLLTAGTSPCCCLLLGLNPILH